MVKRWWSATALAALLVVAGCGGSGDNPTPIDPLETPPAGEYTGTFAHRLGGPGDFGETIGSGAMRGTIDVDGEVVATVVEGTGDPYTVQGTLEADGDFPSTTIRAGAIYNATGTWSYIGGQLTLVIPNAYQEPSTLEVLLQPIENQ